MFIPTSTLEKFTTFGDLLRFLRQRVGLTQIDLAAAVGYSHSQISRLEQNLRLPDIPTIENHFVSALGLEDEPKAVARLLELAANVRREDAPALGLCPYKGLSYFDEIDADLFVGREALTNKLMERVLSLATSGEPPPARFLAVVGASGSGKSSLVRAGLVSALRWNKTSADWQVQVLTPTAHPLESLAAALTYESSQDMAATTLVEALASDPRSLQLFVKRSVDSNDGSHLLLAVDQFEEVFTLCRLEEERAAFIESLLTAAAEADGPVIVLIALRADFYPHCADYARLREALAHNQEYIGAMTHEELRRAIEEPARRGRWELEPGLVNLLLHDVGHEPGALPLLSHALFETWQRRRGRSLTLSGYTSTGGVRGAIAETAETVFNDQFTHEQQVIARRIFLRLTELGDEAITADTRRRAAISELILNPEEAEPTQIVLRALADARLITTSEDTAEVAHEALIREWPKLRGWLEENREGLRLHHHLAEAAQEWLGMERSPDLVYRGARLAQAREWDFNHAEEMNTLEREFLAASAEASEREAQEREAQRQRELEAAQKLAETQKQAALRLRMRNRMIASVGVIALLLAVLAGVFALSSNQYAHEAQADTIHADAQRIAVEADNLMLNNSDPNLIALLDIRSLAMQYTPAGDTVLTGLTSLQAPPIEIRGHSASIYGAAFSPDGKYLATASADQTARLWDTTTGKLIRIFKGHSVDVEWVAFSPDGKTLVTISHDRTIRVWDAASGLTLKIIPAPAELDCVAFSPDGRFIATTGLDPVARIWDVATGQTVHTLTGHTTYTTGVAYSPDGKYVLTGSGDNTARLWNAATGDQVMVFSGHTGGVSSVAFTPDGKYAATGDDHTIRLWDISTGQKVREFNGHEPGNFISGIDFTPDGKYMATSGSDQTARLWDVATGQFIRFFGGRNGQLYALKFSPDGRLVVTAGDFGIAKIWTLQTFRGGRQLEGHSAPVEEASFSPDGKRVVTASQDHTARIWDPLSGQTVLILTGHTDEVHGAVFSPDGKQILTASADGTARLWDAATGVELRRFVGHTGYVNKAIFSPDGKYVATASFDGTARVWDAQTGRTIVIYRSQGPSRVNRIAYSPDGKTVATSGDDGTARIWDPLTGKDLMILKDHTAEVNGVAFSPDGKYLLTASNDSTVRLWDAASGKEARRFAGQPGGAFGAAFSPDGKYALSTGVDGTARLWEVQTGQEVRRFTGQADLVRNGVFSPDGKYILIASQDNTARLWLTSLNDAIHAVCGMLTRDLTPEERIQFEITDPGPTCPAK